MHSGEPDPIFPAPRRPRKGPRKLVRQIASERSRSSHCGVPRQSDPQALARRGMCPRPVSRSAIPKRSS
jgi:hypothetical protein